MTISDFLKEGRIKVKLNSKNKSDIIKEMVDLLGNADSMFDNKEVLKSIIERENSMSTGIGNGIAIPHGKCSSVKNLVGSIGINKEGIPFDSIDGNPVKIIFMLVAPTGPSASHIKALSLMSKILNNEDARKNILICDSPKDVFSVLVNEEKKYL